MSSQVVVFNVGNSQKSRDHFMAVELRNLHVLTRQSANGKPLDDTDNGKRGLERCYEFLVWMKQEIQMTPWIKKRFNVDRVLTTVIGSESKMPDKIKEDARELLDKWTSENWGANAVTDEDVHDSDEDSGGTVVSTATVNISANDPIWGAGGIFDGVIRFKTDKGRRVWKLNPQFAKRDAKVFGHNGHHIGAWFANQLVALARGAHGMRIGGISGDTKLGTYSIVVADTYHDLDEDRGNTLFYSGSDSHNNDDPTKPSESTSGTQSLKMSLRRRRPIRVLRSGGSYRSPAKRNAWLPECGLRYDGLYNIVQRHLKINRKGGQYEQFELRRQDGQPPISSYRQTSPSQQQIMDLSTVQDD
ncbi:PUA-like domain-containing protein [Xylariaceae sp. FL0016]|nr:PUA-like domain-containing protein [Xylariaceae sp. FL0016]